MLSASGNAFECITIYCVLYNSIERHIVEHTPFASNTTDTFWQMYFVRDLYNWNQLVVFCLFSTAKYQITSIWEYSKHRFRRVDVIHASLTTIHCMDRFHFHWCNCFSCINVFLCLCVIHKYFFRYRIDAKWAKMWKVLFGYSSVWTQKMAKYFNWTITDQQHWAAMNRLTLCVKERMLVVIIAPSPLIVARSEFFYRTE